MIAGSSGRTALLLCYHYKNNIDVHVFIAINLFLLQYLLIAKRLPLNLKNSLGYLPHSVPSNPRSHWHLYAGVWPIEGVQVPPLRQGLAAQGL